jgi:hypothetical protein
MYTKAVHQIHVCLRFIQIHKHMDNTIFNIKAEFCNICFLVFVTLLKARTTF